jgi:hypothetical protein
MPAASPATLLWGVSTKTDWRLPDDEGLNTLGAPTELETIWDWTLSGAGVNMIVPVLGPTYPGSYWTGTTWVSTSAWYVNVRDGIVNHVSKTTALPVRAVRSDW